MIRVIQAMKRRASQLLVVLISFGAIGAASADDISGLSRFVCAPAQVTVCDETGACVSVLPWEVNVPRFLVFDLKKKRIGTTEASGENRVTPIQSIVEAEDAIYLQGVEGGRAFSFVINRSNGLMSVAVAREYLTVTGFGACTTSK